MRFEEKMSESVKRGLRWMTVRPVLSLLFALATTGLFGYWTTKLEIRTNLRDLFPEDTPNVVRALEAKRKLPGSSLVLVVVTSPDRDANTAFLTQLHDRLVDDQDVSSVEFRHDVSFFRKNALLFLSADELTKLDERLKKAIRKAVAKDLDPFGDEGADGEAEADDFEKDPFDDSDDDDGEEGEKKAETTAAAEPSSDFELADEEEIARKYGASSLTGYFTNPDGTVLGMKVYPAFDPSDVKRSQAFLDRLHKHIGELDPASFNARMEWALEGDYHKKIEEMSVINQDLTKASAFALSVILLMVVLYFGRLRALLLVFVPLLSGIAWTMGVAWLTVGYLNLITAFIFALMFGLGVDFAVHGTARYYEERQRGLKPAEAVVEGLARLGRPMISAAATTTVTFVSLIIFDFRGFSHFGLIAGLGVPLCLLVVYLFLPPLVVLADRLWPDKPPPFKNRQDAASRLFGTRRKSAAVVGFCLLAALAFAPHVRSLSFEHNMAKVMTKSKEDKRNEVYSRWRKEVENRSASPILLPTSSLEETRRVQSHLNRYRAHYGRLETTSSIFAFVPDGQAEKAESVRRMKQRLDKKMGALKGKDLESAGRAQEFLAPQPFAVEDLPDWVKQKFTDADGNLGHFVLLFARGDKSDAGTVGEILEQVGTIQVDGREYHTSASYYILKDAYDIIREEGPLAVGLAGLAVLIFLILDFRNSRDVLAAMLPLAVGLLCLLGLMGLSEIKLNMFNMVVLPTVLGIGIDTSIHLIHRLRQEGTARVGVIANTTGGAAGMSAATTAVGFGSFALASNPGLVSIGTLAPIGIMLCFLESVLLSCALYYVWSGGQQREPGNQ